MATKQSKIEKLITELCPNGVEFKELGEVAIIKNGKDWKKLNNGNVPVYGTGGVIGYVNDFVYDKPTVLIPRKGSIENIFYLEIPFWNVDTIYYTEINNIVLIPKYFYYFLKTVDLKKLDTGSGRPSLTQAILNKIKIPTPPLAIQQEIVKILDTFTTLEAELEAELEARKKQYEYYREELLTFGDNVEWKELGEICNNVSSGGTPLSTKSEYYGGTIPWLRTQEVHFVDIFDTEVKITEKGLKYSSAKWIPANCVIVAISGATAARSAINKIPLTTNQHCCNFEINSEIAHYRYVFHWVSSKYEELKALGRGARADLTAGIIKQFKIPIPSIIEQERIVTTLDKFDALVNDISVGLPAELNARRKQYEYYRDKLLTFKPLEKEDAN